MFTNFVTKKVYITMRNCDIKFVNNGSIEIYPH